MARPVVLIVGEGGTNASRLAGHVTRRGLMPRRVRDCGEALVALHELEGGRGRGAVRAIVLDVGAAGIGVTAFREMLRTEQPDVAVLELPPDEHGPEDVGLLAAALDDEVSQSALSIKPSEESTTDDASTSEADERFEAPMHGYKFEDLESRSPRMHELFDLIPRVAPSDSPVLIVGETGTGKELVAAAIHRQSARRDQEFFTVNCGALSENLLESELFGHERGAFTGAVKDKPGYFELASGGTLFLDELGTVSHAMQVKLLRVLERMEIRRVGGSRTIPVDVRIVAATNEDLENAVAEGSFREDLYYRLNVVLMRLPPLRERLEDVPLLAEVFREKFVTRMNRGEVGGFSRGAISRLRAYAWPGNVRELQNVIERAVLLTRSPEITERDLPDRVRLGSGKRSQAPTFDLESPLGDVLDQLRVNVEREYIKRLLKRYRGHLGRVSSHAGVNRRTLYNKMRAYGFDRRDYRS